MTSDRDVATRLAKALVADLRLYHERELREGRLPESAVDEARGLFRARVDPALHDVLEHAVNELLAATPPRGERALESTSGSTSKAPVAATPSMDGRSIVVGAASLVALLLLGASVLAYLVSR